MKTKFKFTIVLAMLMLVVNIASMASAYVIRDVNAERQAELDRYNQYREDYTQFYNLDDYEDYIYEPNLERNFGFYPNSRYQMPYDVYMAKYHAPLQGEVYTTKSRIIHSSLNQPNAVKYYADDVNGRYSGYIRPDLNGVYFDHPNARVTYGYISEPSFGYGYNNGYDYQFEGNRYYARVAQSNGDGFYTVGYY